MGRVLAVASLLLAGQVGAQAPRPVVRMATMIPDGTPIARELKLASAEVDELTHGQIKVKWYFGGIAGDEREMEARIRSGQLDGAASGGLLCERVSPSMRALGIPGLFQSHEEAAFVLHQMKAVLADEASQNGFELLNTTGLGPTVIFSREPITSMEALKRTRLWIWDLDQDGIRMQRAMGMNVVPVATQDAYRSYAQGAVDGFLMFPLGALAFQWSTQARYVTDLRMRFMTGCGLVSHRVFDRLTHEQQQIVRSAVAKADVRIEEATRRMDEQLLGGMFRRQGLTPVPASATLRASFFAAAREARDRVGEQLVPRPLLDRVLKILADHRAERAYGAK